MSFKFTQMFEYYNRENFYKRKDIIKRKIFNVLIIERIKI